MAAGRYRAAANRSRAAGGGAGTVRAGSLRGDFPPRLIRGVRRTRVGASQGRTLLKSADNRRDGADTTTSRRTQFRRARRVSGSRRGSAGLCVQKDLPRAWSPEPLECSSCRVRFSACSASSALTVVVTLLHLRMRVTSKRGRLQRRDGHSREHCVRQPCGRKCRQGVLQRCGAPRPYEPVITETGGERGKSGGPSARETSRHRKRE